MQGDRERCLAAGFDDYLAKPIRQAELQAALEADPSPGARSPQHPVVDGLNDICGGDDEFARELATSFLESAPRCLAGIDEALRVGRCAEAGRGSPWPEGDQPDDRRPGSGVSVCGAGARGTPWRVGRGRDRGGTRRGRVGASCESRSNNLRIARSSL